MSKHKIGLTYSKKKKKSHFQNCLKNNKPPNVHLFHMVKTQTRIDSTTRYKNRTQTPTSLPHFSVLLLFFYASDVQNIIAPVGLKHTC